MCIVSMPAIRMRAQANDLKPCIGRTMRLMARWSCSTRLLRYFDWRNLRVTPLSAWTLTMAADEQRTCSEELADRQSGARAKQNRCEDAERNDAAAQTGEQRQAVARCPQRGVEDHRLEDFAVDRNERQTEQQPCRAPVECRRNFVLEISLPTPCDARIRRRAGACWTTSRRRGTWLKTAAPFSALFTTDVS
jgi:hypothetical protein